MSKNKRISGWVGATLMTAALLLPAMASAHESPRRDDHPAYWVDRGHDRGWRGHQHKHKHQHRHGHDRHERYGWHDGHADRHEGPRRHRDHGFEDSGLRVFLGYWGRL